MRPLRVVPAAAPVLLALLAACEIERGGSRAPDADTAAAAPDTAETANASLAQVAADSAALDTWPERPQRGGVVWARLRDVGAAVPRCTLDDRPLPCHADGGHALAVVPFPADEPAGTHMLSIEAGGRRGTRQLRVEERDFGRELVFLDSATYALTRDGQAIARDGRAVRAVLGGGGAQRQWGREAWREPRGARGSGYGTERFYHRASDSSRAIALGGDARTAATFGADTSTAPRAAGAAPAWRHAGVDIPLARGTRVLAPADGVVADVGDYQLTGRTLLVDHGQGVFSAFFHLDTVTARRGDRVRAGQALARVGSTGLSTGPHLHYGVYVHGRDVDPAAWKEMPAWLREGDAAAAAPGDSARGGGRGRE